MLCRSISPADVIDFSNRESGLSRVREPVALTLHHPRERMVFDQEENPIEWFSDMRDMFLDPNVTSVFADLTPGHFAENSLRCVLKYETGPVFDMRTDRGYLDVLVTMPGFLHIQEIGKVAFHMTMMQEWISTVVKIRMGIFDLVLPQVMLPKGMEYVHRMSFRASDQGASNPYRHAQISEVEMVGERLLTDIEMYPAMGLINRYVRRVLAPMWQAFDALCGEEPDAKKALECVERCEAGDVLNCASDFLVQNFEGLEDGRF